MNKKTKKKIQIAEAAADRYVENERFSFESLAEKMGTDTKEILNHFPSRRSILEFYYEAQLIRYREISSKIDGYDQFTLAEKLSNLALTLLDLFNENREFVVKSYSRFIVCTRNKTAFEKQILSEFDEIISEDQNKSTITAFLNSTLLHRALLHHFHGLVKFWSTDRSENFQKSMELIDKWTALAEAIAYSGITDKAAGLAKFLIYNSPFKECSVNRKNMRDSNE